jgi:hypothetical protein
MKFINLITFFTSSTKSTESLKIHKIKKTINQNLFKFNKVKLFFFFFPLTIISFPTQLISATITIGISPIRKLLTLLLLLT